jgi:hypothetical protein
MFAFTPPTTGTLIMVSMTVSAIGLILLQLMKNKKNKVE